ncbi:MAG TPA: hypothetical protein VIH65_05260 [Xanthobacteraceae bacterium]
MTREILKLAMAGLFAIAIITPSFGLDRREQRNVYVSAGRETRIASYGTPDEKCRAGAGPEIEVAERPSYGKLTDKAVRIVAERAGVARPDHPCLGRFIESIAVYYRPVAGFRGSDRVRLRVKFGTTPAADAAILEEEIFISVR